MKFKYLSCSPNALALFFRAEQLSAYFCVVYKAFYQQIPDCGQHLKQNGSQGWEIADGGTEDWADGAGQFADYNDGHRGHHWRVPRPGTPECVDRQRQEENLLLTVPGRPADEHAEDVDSPACHLQSYIRHGVTRPAGVRAHGRAGDSLLPDDDADCCDHWHRACVVYSPGQTGQRGNKQAGQGQTGGGSRCSL